MKPVEANKAGRNSEEKISRKAPSAGCRIQISQKLSWVAGYASQTSEEAQRLEREFLRWM